ncbi:cytochrome c oxidase subunit II [Mesorhizobium sp. BAC0120]|uniref:cytochrome c oxidase subunit II n=1 Tax=Mesorhizobium sp. BAC0120 TaxID=3090670 RepID=UPI00298CBE69|nr:cytochrome c oxidase subunit II [Mesorhizobium sp. BAC0120]MDW6023551.1 cytochrome c oxidase subunit II [Mesorhizobium sp. BAC0120]
MIDQLLPWASQASTHASEVDLLAFTFLLLIALLAAPVFILIVVFAVKYRRGRPADRSDPVNRSIWIETSWAMIPFILTLAFFVWATHLYADLYYPPADALEVDVVAKQWMWKFEHPGGQREINELHVPVNEPVKLIMASQDVIHSLFIPALRIKRDVVPGRYTTMWFTADKPGIYHLTCSQFCGTDHSLMGGRFVVMTKADYTRWLEESGVDQSLVDRGAALFRSKGCSGCHGPSSTVHAPPLEGLFGSPVPLQSGEVVTADERYIRDSILLPHSQVAAGYPDIMPTFQNILDEEQVMELVAYIKSLRTAPRKETR